jgi:membrane-associated phospholipid phosphatase
MKYKDFFTKERVRSLCVALVLLALALTFQYYASAYSTRNANRFVGDIFLDNLPVVNMNGVIIEGALLLIVISMVLVLCKPKYLLFTLKAVAIFIAIRAFFVAVTHLGIYPDQIVPDSNGFLDRIYLALNLQAGYFFSAHTGLPFLLALIFWDKRFWRIFYFIVSAIMGISVLLAHVHYSIDVFAAPFMTYSIFKLAEYLFSDDYKLIEG